MVELFIYLIILSLVAGLAYWIVGQLPIGQPFLRIAQVVIVALYCLAVLLLLLNLLGYSVPLRGRL